MIQCVHTATKLKVVAKRAANIFALVSHIVRDFKFCLRNQRVAAKIGLKNFSSCWCRCNLKGSIEKIARGSCPLCNI